MSLGFDQEYKKLNKAQKEAVDNIDGPVMVVAGPGTGKTQILALRIGNILLETDTDPDGVLCLTFTNSGVSAMRDRLHKYIGPTASKVNIFTFHGFGMEVIREHFGVLGFDAAPKLMDDMDSVALVDQILHNNEWKYLRPRSNSTLYFRDLKSLISLLKRERMSPEDFQLEIEKEIKNLNEDENSISTRGESKGELKKEVVKKIESLNRTIEVVRFYELYEHAKGAGEIKLLDYDDVLTYLVKIVEESEDVRDEIKEKYLYVLIDEHQDSSGIQNEFLKIVWGQTERPNIFVVGDDRQLIYGFGGASLEYFEGFKHSFGQAKLVTLTENYRSTQMILDSAHALLESSITKEKLVGQTKGADKIRLIEAEYGRDEIIACALDIQEKVKIGVDINDCAILVPKNKQVRSTVTILRDMGLPVSSANTLRFFDSSTAAGLVRVLKVVANPYDVVSIGALLFDKISGIDPLSAHKFSFENKLKDFSLVDFIKSKKPSLFQEDDSINVWFENLASWVKRSRELGLYSTVQMIGDELLLAQVKDHNVLVSRVEIIRTLLHLTLSVLEKNPRATIVEFVEFLDRLESYDENIPLAVFGKDEGVKVLTLHSSKGLEFEYVWIAHMDERSMSSGKKQSFALPESVSSRQEDKDVEVLKRQLYVAVTRAKRFCTMSYALNSYTGAAQELAHTIKDLLATLSPDLWDKQTSQETEQLILKHGPKDYIKSIKPAEEAFGSMQLVALVKKEYTERRVSVSLLNNFFECPWKWYFRNLLQLPEPKSDSLEFGNAVHATIDNILKLRTAPQEKELIEIIKREVSKLEFKNDIKQSQTEKEVLGVVVRWVKNRLPQIKESRENEKNAPLKDDRFPHLNIYGKIDLVEYLDGPEANGVKRVRVTDFKTGSVRKKSEVESMDEEGRMSSYLRQLAMYSYLLEQNTKSQINVVESRLEFLEASPTKPSKDGTEAFYDRVITPKEISMLVQDITDYDSMLSSGSWINRKCNYIPYGRSGAQSSQDSKCEYCQLAEIYTKSNRSESL